MDYKRERFEKLVTGVDVVLDTVRGDTQQRSLKVMKTGGILVSVVILSGYNRENFTSGPNAGARNPAESNEYILFFNISGTKPLQMQVLQVANTFDGLAFNPNGTEFYATGGPNDF